MRQEHHPAKKSRKTKAEKATSPTAKTSEPTAKSIIKKNLSPFTKRVNNRRKKADQAAMQNTPQECLQVQGVMLEHMKKTDKMSYDDMKLHLRSNVEGKGFKNFSLNPYFSRGAVGVKTLLIHGDKTTEFCYFGKTGTAKSFNTSCTLAFVSASLMVPWLIIIRSFTCSINECVFDDIPVKSYNTQPIIIYTS